VSSLARAERSTSGGEGGEEIPIGPFGGNPSEISDIFAVPLVGKRCKLSPREIQSGGPRDP